MAIVSLRESSGPVRLASCETLSISIVTAPAGTAIAEWPDDILDRVRGRPISVLNVDSVRAEELDSVRIGVRAPDGDAFPPGCTVSLRIVPGGERELDEILVEGFEVAGRFVSPLLEVLIEPDAIEVGPVKTTDVAERIVPMSSPLALRAQHAIVKAVEEGHIEPVAGWDILLDTSASMAGHYDSGLIQALVEVLFGAISVMPQSGDGQVGLLSLNGSTLGELTSQHVETIVADSLERVRSTATTSNALQVAESRHAVVITDVPPAKLTENLGARFALAMIAEPDLLRAIPSLPAPAAWIPADVEQLTMPGALEAIATALLSAPSLKS